MTGFDLNNQKSIANFIIQNLPRHQLMALATVDTSNIPWVVCVGLSHDSQMNIIWKSDRKSEHSKNISRNPEVSICIFSHEKEIGDFGFYIKAIAHEITDEEELISALKARYAKKGIPSPPHTDFLGNSSSRIYSAQIREAWVTDDRHLKISVNLDDLKNYLRNRKLYGI